MSHKGLQWLRGLKSGMPTLLSRRPREALEPGTPQGYLRENRAGRQHLGCSAAGRWLRKTNYLRKVKYQEVRQSTHENNKEIRKHLTQELLSSAHDSAF